MFKLLIALSAASPAALDHVHRETVEHRGQPVELSYRPQVNVTTRTVGMAAGTRMSTERCRWTAHVQVGRQIARANAGAVATLLPGTRVIENSLPGHCSQAAAAVDRAVAGRSEMVRDHVVAVAAADRPAALAAIDAAGVLASN